MRAVDPDVAGDVGIDALLDACCVGRDGFIELKPDHELIRFRKNHLTRYLVALVSKSYDEKMVAYLDMVGKIHTNKAGARDIAVPLVQMNALMGYVSDALVGVLLGLDIDCALKKSAVRAFNKLLWLQNDLITRHYQADRTQAAGHQGNGKRELAYA